MNLRRATLFALLSAMGCASTGSAPPRDLAGSGGGDGGGGGFDFAGQKLDFSWVVAPDLVMAPDDLAMQPDLVVPGLPYGGMCQQDGDCQSKLCKAVLQGGPRICVTPCKGQMDCMGLLDAFCEAVTPMSPDGFCIPRSPTHCSSCTQDSECGGLSERCIQAPGDIAPACHIDCALAPNDACPADYSCADVPDGNTMRKLCVPKLGVCLDSIGGWCDRVGLPQPCARTNMAGTCNGQRLCLMNSKRYDKCGAMAPQYKMSCNDLDPAGCMLKFAPNVANTKQNCGMCGNACKNNEDCCNGVCTALGTVQNCASCGNGCGNNGCCANQCIALNTVQNCGACAKVCACVGSNNSDASCANNACGLTCRGENYDVNNNAGDCCEALHASISHNSAQPTSTGKQLPCTDGSSNPNIAGTMHSDSRTHANPAVLNFNGAVGSAPDFQSVFATGGLCQDDFDITLQMNGGTGACYRLRFITNNGTWTATTNNAGTARVTGGSGSYSDGTTITFGVDKVCNLPVQETVPYSITGHL